MSLTQDLKRQPKTHMNITKTLFLLPLLLAGISGYSQEKLSLNDAIIKGLERNFDIRIERRNVEIAQLNNNWGLLFPTLSASLQGSSNTFDNKEALNPFSLLGEVQTNQIQPQINVNWDLFSILNISMGKRQLEQLQAESEGNADIVVANTVQALILGYYGVVLQLRRLEEFEKQLDLSRDKYAQLKIRVELGTAVTTDLLLEEGNYLTDSVNYINQQLNYQNAVSNLNFLMNESNPTKQYDFTDDLKFEYNDLTYEELLNQMENENVDLRRQYLSQQVLGSTTSLRKLDRLPNLSLGGSYNLTRNKQTIDGRILDGSTGQFNSFLRSGNNQNTNFSVNFTLSWNLLQGGRVYRAIKEATIREDIGNAQIERLRSSLRRDLVQALDQYNVRKQLYDINNRRFASSELNLELSEERFNNGTINSFDYRTVQNNHLSAATLRLQSIYDLIDSQVTLLRLTGGLLHNYASQ